MVHCEPHEHISWAEFQYVVDEYGGVVSFCFFNLPFSFSYVFMNLTSFLITFLFPSDIFFEVFDDENILQDRGASNPVVRTSMRF